MARISLIFRRPTVVKLLALLALLYMIVMLSLYISNPIRVKELPKLNILRPLDTPESGFDLSAAREIMLNRSNDFQPFNWEDWVDTTELPEKQRIAEASPRWWPKAWNGQNPFNNTEFPPRSERTEEELALNGRLFLAREAPIPRKVIFLGKDHRVVHIKGSHWNDTLLPNEMQRYNSSLAKIDSLNDLENDTLFPELAAKELSDKITVEIPLEMFIFNMTEKAETNIDSDWDQEKQDHYRMIRWAAQNYKDSPKYFHEVPIKDHRREGMHYDWRFFNQLKSERDHEAFRHHLLRTWSDLTNRYNILSWISQGSMLGWKWNGMSLPWDNDHDIQMPVAELDRFARMFNQTLIVQDPKEGNGRYFIDVGPWYIQRDKGNGRNSIDSRVIDIRSGVYIDITGIAATGGGVEKKEVHCKFNNVYSIEELSPLRRTLFEGVQVYVPNEHELLLEKKYKVFKPARGWRYDDDLRLWVRKEDCDSFMDRSKKFDSDNNLTKYGGCNKVEYAREYDHSKLITKLHYEEMGIYDNHRLSTGQLDKSSQKTINEEVAKLLNSYHPPLRPDPR